MSPKAIRIFPILILFFSLIWSCLSFQRAQPGLTGCDLYFAAVDSGYPVEYLKAYVADGKSIDAPDEEGCTPLWYAVKEKNDEVTVFLIEHGADYMATGDKYSREKHIIDLLIPNVYRDATKSNFYLNSRVLIILLERGFDPNYKNGSGDTLLMLLAR